MTKEPKPIQITNFQKGISQGPFTDGQDFADMRNIDCETRPGSARLNFALQNANAAATTTTFTGSSSSGHLLLTVASTFDYVGSPGTYRSVTVSTSGGSLPTGLSAATTYYLIEASSNTTYYVATSLNNVVGGTYIAYTNSGSGTLNITSGTMTLPKYIVYDSLNNIYFLQDDSGQIWTTLQPNRPIWQLLDGNTLTAANGNGLIIFNNFLLAFRDGSIDTFGSLISFNLSKGFAGSWDNSWQAILDGGGNFDHVPYYSPINGLVYWSEFKGSTGNTSLSYGASGLGSLLQNPGTIFDPTNSSTYTFISARANGAGFALQLPTYNKITVMVLTGGNLMIGTNQYFIYPWDTVSATYALPIIVAEQNITTMTNVGNFLYIAAGNRGNIYFFNGYYAQKVNQVPPYLTGIPQNTLNISNMVKHNGKIYFNVGCVGCSGVWSYNPTTNVVILENVISTGNYSNVTMGVLFSVGTDQILAGWHDLNVLGYSLDGTLWNSSLTYTSSYKAYLETTFYNIGAPLKPRHLENIDFMLGANLVSGQGVKVWARGENSTAYPTTGGPTSDGAVATFDFSTYGAVDSYKLPFGKGYVNVQFKVELTGNGNNTLQLNTIEIN